MELLLPFGYVSQLWNSNSRKMGAWFQGLWCRLPLLLHLSPRIPADQQAELRVLVSSKPQYACFAESEAGGTWDDFINVSMGLTWPLIIFDSVVRSFKFEMLSRLSHRVWNRAVLGVIPTSWQHFERDLWLQTKVGLQLIDFFEVVYTYLWKSSSHTHMTQILQIHANTPYFTKENSRFQMSQFLVSRLRHTRNRLNTCSSGKEKG